jgi:putative ABC transport system permease protein
MNLLRLISWPYARKHGLRLLLTMSGIALGVAVLVAMHAANGTVSRSFSQTVNRIAGATQLQVFVGDTGFSEDVLTAVQSRPEVRVAVPIIEESVNTGIPGQGNLLVLGVDMLGDSSLRQYDIDSSEDEVVDDLLVFLAQPDSLIITREFAQANHLGINDRMVLPTAEGPKRFTVRGIMRPGGLASVFGGNLAVMDIYAAQKMFGRGRFYDRIDLALKPGVSVAAGQTALRQILGPGFRVEPPAARAQEFDSLLQAYARIMDLMSVFALVVGLYIIYNSFSIAVTQRRSEIGILRACGATQKQVRRIFLLESTVVGIFASAAGVVFGLFMAWAALKYVSGLLQVLYGVSAQTEGISVGPGVIVGAFAVGAFTSVIAALLPARAAAAVDPIQALQKGKYQVFSTGEHRIRQSVAAAIIVVSVVCLAFGTSSVVFYTGYVLSILAIVLLAPSFLLWFTGLLRFVAQWLRPVEGPLASDSLIQAPRRTSATISALVLSLAVVVALGGVSRATYVSVRNWLYNTLNPDLLVTPSENIVAHNFLFPASMEPELSSIPGVTDVLGERTTRVRVAGASPLLLSADLNKLFAHIKPDITEGDRKQMVLAASQGQGVIVSDNFSTLQNLHLHDQVEIPTPTETLVLPIAGVISDYSSQEGCILLDRAVFQRYWKTSEVDIFRIHTSPSTSVDEVKRMVLQKFGGRRSLFVLTSRELRDYVLRAADQWFGLTYLQILIAVLVAVLGIANTLFVSIADRRRELAVLRAIGGLRSQIRRIIMAEAFLIALIGLIIGISVGAVNLYYTLEVARREILGIRLTYQFPWKIVALLLPSIFIAAWISAVLPARSAVRGSLVEALEYE